jgi:phospholipid transport system substrate-binding protein
MNRATTVWLWLWAALASGAVAASTATPDVLVRTTTDEILVRIKTHKDAYAKDTAKLYAMVDELVVPHFDFRAMAKLVLAQSWRQASEDQRTRFTSEFRDLLVRTYSTALLKYNDEQVIYLPYKGPTDERTAVVRVEVKPSGGGPNVPIEYNFYFKDGAWKVYDVKVEAISLVTNYRAVYAERVQKEGLDALIASLARDNREGKVDQPVRKSAAGAGGAKAAP